MRYIIDVKSRASLLARAYVDGKYSHIVNSVKRAWGFVPSYRLERVSLDLERGASSTVLAAFIAENTILYRDHGKLENLIVSLVGIGGSGKTTYAIHSCAGAMHLLGVPLDRAYDAVDELTAFTLEDMIRILERVIESRTWVPCIIADDVGEWLSKYWRDLKMLSAVSLFKLLDQAKDWVGVLVFTARSFEGSIPANIRDKSDYIVDSSSQLIDYHRLSIFEFYLGSEWTPKSSKAKYRRLLYLDAVPATLKMPDKIWNRMMQSRQEHARKALEQLRKLSELMSVMEDTMITRLEAKLKKLLKTTESEEEEEE